MDILTIWILYFKSISNYKWFIHSFTRELHGIHRHLWMPAKIWGYVSIRICSLNKWRVDIFQLILSNPSSHIKVQLFLPNRLTVKSKWSSSGEIRFCMELNRKFQSEQSSLFPVMVLESQVSCRTEHFAIPPSLFLSLCHFMTKVLRVNVGLKDG